MALRSNKNEQPDGEAHSIGKTDTDEVENKKLHD